MDVEGIIERAKSVFEVRTDLELAGSVGIPRATIASWKRRQSIPAKYLAALVPGGVSLDWLLTGKGEIKTVDVFGSDNRGTMDLDDDALRVALVFAIEEMIRNSPPGAASNVGELFDKRAVMRFHITVQQYYARALRSKRAWISSGLVAEGDAYKALNVEYALGDFESYLPWWEDSDLI